MKKMSKKKTRKIFLMVVVMVITAVVLVVETYAWFVGISTVNVGEFNVKIESSGGLEISLDGQTWKKDSQILNVTGTTIMATTGTGDHAYAGHTNKYPSNGLIPISSPGLLDTSVSRLKFYQKSSLASTAGGYRIVADRVDNYTVTNNTLVSEADGYAVFDLFIRNGLGNEYNSDMTESVYMLPNPVASVGAGTNFGAANSLRVAFFTIGTMKSATASSNLNDLLAIKCTGSPANTTAKCSDTAANRTTTWNIWEPNDAVHTQPLVNYFTSICKLRNSNGSYSSSPCTLATDNSSKPIYAINNTITASDDVDVYDGAAVNGYTGSVTNNLLRTYTSYKTTTADSNDSNRESLLKLPGNSVTKVRVYVWLEGQDVDNYDVITNNNQISISFGLTKDRFGLRTASSSP